MVLSGLRMLRAKFTAGPLSYFSGFQVLYLQVLKLHLSLFSSFFYTFVTVSYVCTRVWMFSCLCVCMCSWPTYVEVCGWYPESFFMSLHLMLLKLFNQTPNPLRELITLPSWYHTSHLHLLRVALYMHPPCHPYMWALGIWTLVQLLVLQAFQTLKHHSILYYIFYFSNRKYLGISLKIHLTVFDVQMCQILTRGKNKHRGL